MTQRFNPGDAVVLREMWRGHVWEQGHSIVVRDEPGLIALYRPPFDRAQVAVDAAGNRLRLPAADWSLTPARSWDRQALALHPPGADHSVLLVWEPGFADSVCWYINLESDLQRTADGFEYVGHVLDVIVEPDRTAWRWKDEDELEETVALGLFTRTEAAAIRAEGERALEWLLARRPPYNERWEDWRPEASWAAGENKGRPSGRPFRRS